MSFTRSKVYHWNYSVEETSKFIRINLIWIYYMKGRQIKSMIHNKLVYGLILYCQNEGIYSDIQAEIIDEYIERTPLVSWLFGHLVTRVRATFPKTDGDTKMFFVASHAEFSFCSQNPRTCVVFLSSTILAIKGTHGFLFHIFFFTFSSFCRTRSRENGLSTKWRRGLVVRGVFVRLAGPDVRATAFLICFLLFHLCSRVLN